MMVIIAEAMLLYMGERNLDRRGVVVSMEEDRRRMRKELRPPLLVMVLLLWDDEVAAAAASSDMIYFSLDLIAVCTRGVHGDR